MGTTQRTAKRARVSRSPFRRLLVAVDRSGHAREAIETAADLALALTAEVRVLHVLEAPLTASLYSDEDLERARIESTGMAKALVERAVAMLSERGIAASGTVRTAGDTTVRQIVAEVAGTGADLLVIGTLGTSRWRDLLVGGVTHAAVQLAPCPVLVVCRRPATGSLRRLVVGVDGSAAAARAVDLTSALASRLGATVLVVHVTEGSAAAGEPDALVAAAAAAVGPERIAAARVRPAGQAGVAGALGSAAEEFGAGMLVVGRRGRSSLERLVLGGVSERLLHVAPCPVVVVPSTGG
jgi:nucleotide-binding universal stress UspA family protein